MVREDMRLTSNGEGPPSWVVWLLRILAAVATGASAYLAWFAMQATGVVGCGVSVFDCDAVLQSRWSKVLGIPVSIPGTLLYGVVFVLLLFCGRLAPEGLRLQSWSLARILIGTAALSGLWFTGLQILSVDALCSYCLLIHVSAWLMATLALSVCSVSVNQRVMLVGPGVVLVGALIVAQMAMPAPTTHQEVAGTAGDGAFKSGSSRPAVEGAEVDPSGTVEFSAPGPVVPSVPDGGAVPEDNAAAGEVKPPSRQIVVMGGKLARRLQDGLVVGDPTAEFWIVELFDYTCPHCRELHFEVKEVLSRFEGKVSILKLPMPLDKDCNPYIARQDPRHQYACELARVAIAVYLAAPDKFAEMEDWLFGGSNSRTPQAAEEFAKQLIGAAEFDKAKDLPRIDQQIAENVRIYKYCNGGPIPKVILSGEARLEGVFTTDVLVDRIAKDFKLVPKPAKEKSLWDLPL